MPHVILMIQHPSVLSPLLRQMLSPVEADHLVLPPSFAGTEAHGLQWLSGSLCEAAPAAWSQQGRQQPRGLHLPSESLQAWRTLPVDSGNSPMSLPQKEWCHFCYKPCLSPWKSPVLSHLRGCLRRVSRLSLLMGACLSVCFFGL